MRWEAWEGVRWSRLAGLHWNEVKQTGLCEASPPGYNGRRQLDLQGYRVVLVMLWWVEGVGEERKQRDRWGGCWGGP